MPDHPDLIFCCDETDDSVSKRRAVDVVYFDSKAFDTLFHRILLVRLVSYGVDKWPVRGMENCLGHKIQRGMINDTNSNQQLVSSGIIQGLSLRPIQCNNGKSNTENEYLIYFYDLVKEQSGLNCKVI